MRGERHDNELTTPSEASHFWQLADMVASLLVWGAALVGVSLQEAGNAVGSSPRLNTNSRPLKCTLPFTCEFAHTVGLLR